MNKECEGKVILDFFWHRSVRKDAFDTISSFQTHFQQVLVQPTSSVARASGSMKAR
jgi:hypothetical protein